MRPALHPRGRAATLAPRSRGIGRCILSSGI
jgi:hypothetical protein